MCSSMKKYSIAIEPSFKKGVFIPPPQRQCKSNCVMAFLWKWFIPSKTHELTFIMEYEECETDAT